ncbi:MAG: hypothetical protein QNJ09_18690 [Paracoccaceae bacterium]|nr:hypothetical protein [Paracoccaceae bacterium]
MSSDSNRKPFDDTPAERDPAEISDYLLRKTGEAFISGDFDSFAECFELPQDIETFEGQRHLETLEDLRSLFTSLQGYFRSLGVTSLERHCIEAKYRDPDTIAATHQSRLMTGSVLLRAPYPAFSVLKRRDGVWRVAFSQYAISDAPEHLKAFGITPANDDNNTNTSTNSRDT